MAKQDGSDDCELTQMEERTFLTVQSDYTSYPILSSYDYEKLQERSWEAYHIRHALPLPRKPQDSHQEKAKLGDRYTRSFLGEEVHDVFRPGPAKPHIAFSIANSWNADDGKLFRTEILAAVKMMIRHLWHKATWDYFVHPVCAPNRKSGFAY